MKLSERLKIETRGAHDAIEAAFGLERWLASRESYAELLRRLYGFHTAVERAAEPHLAGTALAGSLGRAALLGDDLQALGSSASAARMPEYLPRSRAEAAGAIYVLEGSALGGLLIAREIEGRLGIGPDTGAGFFSGRGRDTMRHWREVQAAIDALSDPATDGDAVAGANRTFAAMQAAVTEPVARAA